MKDKKQKLECEKCGGKEILFRHCLDLRKNQMDYTNPRYRCEKCRYEWNGTAKGFGQRLIEQQKDLDPEISEMVDRKIWNEKKKEE